MAATARTQATTESLPVRPRLAADVLVHAPLEPGEKHLLERNGRSFFRVSEDVARLAELLTGDHDQEELVDLLGGAWDLATLQQALLQLDRADLLDDGSGRAYAVRRIHVAPPMSIQFSLVDPSALLARLTFLVHLAGRGWVRRLAVATGVAGLLILLLLHDDVRRVLSSPIDSTAILWMVAASFVFTALHELAHGAVLVSHGGRPRRMGVMLFYLLPAFFCDVSDGWRLPRRVQRVQVAMAGIAVQAATAGASGVVALLARGSTAGDIALLVAIATYLATAVNLIPFVKFDGYIALMSALDIPHLRRSTIRDARSFLSQRLFGTRRERELDRWWSVPFGLASIVFPLYLIAGVAFFLWVGMFQGMGVVAAVVTLSLVCGIAGGTVQELLLIVRRARDLGGSMTRIALVGSAIVAAVLLALSVVRVPQHVPGYFAHVPDGGTTLYVSESAAQDLSAGQVVKLRSNGLAVRLQVGEAVIAADEPTAARVALDEVSPVDLSTGVSLDFHAFPLDVTEQPSLTRGTARVSVGDRSALQWINDRYIRPALAF